jgi:serine/threonine-protein phosphatase PGAM5
MLKLLPQVFGVVAISGTTLTYYFNKLKHENLTADCKPYQPSDDVNPQHLAPWLDNWDYRHPTSIPADAKEKEKAPTATRHVILVRHGQYVHSKEGRQFKVLTELGKEQAAMTGERLKALNVNFDTLIISSMVRAHQTGKIIGEALPHVPQQVCSLLEEGSPYPVVPSRADLETYEWKLMTFADHPRIESAFRKYIRRADPDQEKDSYDLLVCHGNVIRYFVCRALQFPPEGWLRMSTANCGITWITIRPNGRVSLRGFGDVGHLPSNLITYN